MNTSTILASILVGLFSGVSVRADDGDDTLKFFLSKSDLVVAGKITTEPVARTFEAFVPNYLCEFKVDDIAKGDQKLKGQTIKVNIKRFEQVDQDKHPFVKKDAACILFLKSTSGGSWETADFWFGVQSPGPWMMRSLQRLAHGTRPATTQATLGPEAPRILAELTADGERPPSIYIHFKTATPAGRSYVSVDLMGRGGAFDGPRRERAFLPPPRPRQLVQFLAERGLLEQATDRTQGSEAWLKSPGPRYFMLLVGSRQTYWIDLGWGLPMLRELQALREQLDGGPAAAMDKLLTALEPDKQEWETASATQPALGRAVPNATTPVTKPTSVDIQEMMRQRRIGAATEPAKIIP